MKSALVVDMRPFKLKALRILKRCTSLVDEIVVSEIRSMMLFMTVFIGLILGITGLMII